MKNSVLEKWDTYVLKSGCLLSESLLFWAQIAALHSKKTLVKGREDGIFDNWKAILIDQVEEKLNIL